MKTIRIGNDLTVRWSIFIKTEEGRSEYNLEGRDLTLKVQDYYRTQEVSEFSVSGNELIWMFRGREQRTVGTYNLALVENDGMNNMHTIDVAKAFELVPQSAMVSGGDVSDIAIDTVYLDGVVEYGGYEDTAIWKEVEQVKASIPVKVSQLENDVNFVKRVDLNDDLAKKQDVIADLEQIRTGAAKGATALQEHQDISHLATKTELEATKAELRKLQSDAVKMSQDIKTLQETSTSVVEKTKVYDIDSDGNMYIIGVAGYDGTNMKQENSLQSYLAYLESHLLPSKPVGSFNQSFNNSFNGGKTS